MYSITNVFKDTLALVCCLQLFLMLISAEVKSAEVNTPLELAKQSRQLAASGQLELAIKKSLQALESFDQQKNKNTLLLAYVLDDLASLYYRSRDSENARTYSQRAYKTISSVQNDKSPKELALAHIAYNQGAIEYAVGNLNIAKKRYEESYQIYLALDNQLSKVISVADALIVLYLDMGQLAPINKLIDKNIEILSVNNEKTGLFNQYLFKIKLGIKLNDSELIEKAKAETEKLVLSLDYQSKIKFDGLMGRVLIYQSKLPEAELKLREIVDGTTANPASIEVANAYYYLGFIYIVQGKVIEAEPEILEALKRYRKIVGIDHPVVGRALHQLAIVNKNIGRLTKSEEYYLRALAIFEKAFGQEHETIAATRLEYSLLLTHMKKLDQAELQSKQAINYFSDKKNKKLYLGYAHSSLGFMLFFKGDYKESRKSFKQAGRLIQSVRGNLSADLPPSLIKLAEIAIKQKKYSEAEREINRAIALLESMGAESPYGLIKALSVKALLMHKMGKASESKVLGDQYIAMLEQRLTIHRNSIVNLALEEQREIRALFEQYVDLNFNQYKKSNSEDLAGEMFKVLQFPHMTGTASAINYMASRLSVKDKQLVSALDERERLVSQLTQSQDQSVGVLSGIKKVNSVPLVKVGDVTKKINKIDDFINKKFPGFAELTNPKSVSVNTLQSVLKDDEAFLLQLTEDDGTSLFYVDRDTIKISKTILTKEELTKRVNKIRHSMDLTREDLRSYAKMPKYEVDDAYYLYQTILSPFEALFQSKKHLIVVLDGAMQNLPPAVLVSKNPSSNSNQSGNVDYRKIDFIGHKIAFSVFPDASSLVSLRSIKKKIKAKKKFIGIGDPDLELKSSTERSFVLTLDTIAEQIFKYSNPSVLRALFSPLPETKIELQLLAKTLGTSNNDLVLGVQATESKIKSLPLNQYQTVGFATHGLLVGEFKGLMEPALVLTPPDKSSIDDNGLLMASEIANLSLNAEWVILSACNTAGPNGRPGAEGMSGLAKSFLYAGARSLLVSHWAIDSRSAALLTTGMMLEIENNKVSKAEALRRAMLRLAFESKAYLAHPAFWAPFIIVGEG